MDVTSIISQVAREGESASNAHGNSTNSDKRPLRRTKKKKVDGGGSSFQSMLCCFRMPKRKTSVGEKSSTNNKHTNLPNGRTVLSPADTMLNRQQDSNDNAVSNCSYDNRYLLPPRTSSLGRKKCAVIDLDETLVHSSFKPIMNPDFVIPVEIDGTVHRVYVLKRPHVDSYLKRMGELYECVLFTASLSKYADPVADLLDKHDVFSARLFRESCVFHRGSYVKDLSLLGRDLNKVIIIDNSPNSYIFHPDNAVPVASWFDDPSDTELLDLLPFLEAIAHSDDVYSVLRSRDAVSYSQGLPTSSLQLQQQLQNFSNEDDEER